MVEKFKMESLKVEGFRGINEEKTFSFDRSVIMLFGDNGTGKSTVLNAIEWCLFGDLAFMQWAETPRTKDELINAFSPKKEATVELILRREGEKYLIIRKKKLGKARTEFQLKLPNGRTFEGDVAEKELFKHLRLTFEDFYRSVYIHQESVRGILTDEPSVRDRYMDRLLGLMVLRDITESIPMRAVSDEVRDIKDELEKLEERRKGAIEEREERVKELWKKAKEEKIADAEIDFKPACEIVKRIIEAINDLEEKLGIEVSKIAYPTSILGLSAIVIKARKALRGLRGIKVPGLDERIKNKELSLGLKAKYERCLEEVRRVEEERGRILSKYGDESRIKALIEETNTRRSKLEDKLRGTEIDLRLTTDAINYLEVTPGEYCPICRSKINRELIFSHLRRHLEEFGERKIVENINRDIRKLKDEVEELGDALFNFSELEKNLDKVNQERSKIEAEIATVVGETFETGANTLGTLSEKILQLEGTINRLQEERVKLDESLNKIEDMIDKVRIIGDILKEAEEVKHLKDLLPETKEKIETLEKKRDELALFEEDIRVITSIATKVQSELAKRVLSQSSPYITEFYTRLYGHPYYKILNIEIQPKEFRGIIKNSYTIKAADPRRERETVVSARFSTAQMNCVALSIYFALSKVLPHNFGVIIMDDPTQSLDGDHKKTLVTILKEVVSYAQLLISTQDEEFQRLLKPDFASQQRHIYSFANWDEHGPQIELAK